MISQEFTNYILDTATFHNENSRALSIKIPFEKKFLCELLEWFDALKYGNYKVDMGGMYGIFPCLMDEDQVIFAVDYFNLSENKFKLIQDCPRMACKYVTISIPNPRMSWLKRVLLHLMGRGEQAKIKVKLLV